MEGPRQGPEGGDTMIVVAYGGGTNSTALLVECVTRGIRPDLILFADTGGEREGTYRFTQLFSDWLVERGMPAIQTVWKTTKDGNRLTLEQQCLDKKILPSLAYGWKKCSQKFKRLPQDKFVNHWAPAKELWKRGEKVVKYIGFDADERRRATIKEDDKYTYEYPLIDWNMGREECIESIEAAGLPLPGKSACYFCPASKKHEILSLPCDLRTRAVAMEENANLIVIKGLGRDFAWKELFRRDDAQLKLFPEVEIACDCYDG